MPTEAKQEKYDQLFTIIKKLRGENGCPWDRQQTPESMKKYLLEEARELAEAIESGNHDHIREEIGDLFYILIMLIIMHEEQNTFSSDNVLAAISAKMVRRHPHVFAGQPTGSDNELRRQWEDIKAAEKKQA